MIAQALPASPEAASFVLEVLRFVAQGSVGVALIAVFYLFLRDRTVRDKLMQARDGQYLASIDSIAKELSANQRRSDERFERLMDRVISNGHEMALAVSEIKNAVGEIRDAVNNQGRALTSLEAAFKDLTRNKTG